MISLHELNSDLTSFSSDTISLQQSQNLICLSHGILSQAGTVTSPLRGFTSLRLLIATVEVLASILSIAIHCRVALTYTVT